MLDSILSKYINNEKASSPFSVYSLKGVESLLDRLGNPHNTLKFIHVAGTNGKGSTCNMIHAIFSAHGLKCGLYTSPHLKRINERIIVD